MSQYRICFSEKKPWSFELERWRNEQEGVCDIEISTRTNGCIAMRQAKGGHFVNVWSSRVLSLENGASTGDRHVQMIIIVFQTLL